MMHRFLRGTVIRAALVVTAAPLSAQCLFDRAPGTSGASICDRGGIGRFMRVMPPASATRLGVELGVLAPETHTVVTCIASVAAPTTRRWEQTVVRTLAAVPDGAWSINS